MRSFLRFSGLRLSSFWGVKAPDFCYIFLWNFFQLFFNFILFSFFFGLSIILSLLCKNAWRFAIPTKLHNYNVLICTWKFNTTMSSVFSRNVIFHFYMVWAIKSIKIHFETINFFKLCDGHHDVTLSILTEKLQVTGLQSKKIVS